MADHVRSRRRLLRALGAGAFAAASAASLHLFGTRPGRQTPRSCPSLDRSDADRALQVSNWPQYIDPPAAPGSTLSRFERDSGITVRYVEEISDANLYFSRIRNQLGNCEPINPDLFIVNNEVTTRTIRLGWVQPLDHTRLTRAKDNLLPVLRDSALDPGRHYTLPWQAGFTAIAYNSERVAEVRSFADLVSRADLHGRVSLLFAPGATMGFMLKLVGAEPAGFTDLEWERAVERLRAIRRSGQIRAFTGSEYVQDLVAGNILAGMVWSGDATLLPQEAPHIRVVEPEEGMELWCDNMQIPNRARRKANAERWMDFYYEPEVAAQLSAHTGCLSPVRGAREAMARTSPALADNPWLFPDDATLNRSWAVMPMDAARYKRLTRLYTAAIGGST